MAFSSLTGEDCPQDSTRGIDMHVVSFGWGGDNGSWSGDGCSGTYRFHSVMPDGPDWFTWWFETGGGPARGCSITVFVPSGTHVSSASAPYDVYASGSRIGGFTIDEVDNQGRWISVGTYSATGRVEIRLVDRGDTGQVAAGALRISCG